MKTAIIYIRVSSAAQVEGTSLDTQEADCRAFAARNGYTVAALFRDEGESAKTADRPGLQQSLEFVKRHKPDAYIVHKIDRLSRNTTDGLTIKAKLKASGTELLSATEALTDDPVGEMMSTILLSVAQFDNAQRAARCKRGMESVANAGGWVHTAPHGFMLTRRESDNLSILEPDPIKAPAIREALKALAGGQIDLAGCYTLLDRAGYAKQTVAYILRNPVYGGIIRSTLTGGRDVSAAFPGLISIPEFYRIQAMLQPGNIVYKDNPALPYKGMLYCDACGAKLTGGQCKGRNKTYTHYWCDKCHGSKISETELVKKIETAMLNCEGMVLAMDVIRERVKKHAATLAKNEKDKRRAAHLMREKLDNRLAKLTTGWMDGIITEDLYRAKSAELRRQIGEQTIICDQTDANISHILDRLEKAAEILREPLQTLNRLKSPQRRRFLEILFGGFAVTPEKTIKVLNQNNPTIYHALMLKKHTQIQDGGPGWI